MIPGSLHITAAARQRRKYFDASGHCRVPRYEQVFLWHEGHACMAKSGNACKFFMWVDEVLQCPCGKGHCRKRTSKTSKSYGRSFYVCPQST
ncbi:hypothetical protein Taro_017814, partial [Colocasia esculenta]|nr:hypothetical protein [Colocasia esculenta]